MTCEDMNSINKKAELCSMTWKELKKAFEKNPVILIPMGSCEQHGPQTPVGDYRYTVEISKRIAENIGAISAPTIPWGYSEYFKNFPGCITLRTETLKALLIDIVDSIIKFDLDHLVFVCGHKGNIPIIEHAARSVKDKYGIKMATIEPLSWLSMDFLRKVYGKDQFQKGHGSDPMTSLALYLFPNDVRMDLAEKGYSGTYDGKPLTGMSNLDFNGYSAQFYFNTEEIAPNGILGDPFLAKREVGKQCMKRMVDIGTKFVKWFEKQNTY